MKVRQKLSGIPYCSVDQFEDFYVDPGKDLPDSYGKQMTSSNVSSYFSIFLRTLNPCKAEIDINRSEFFKILLITRGSGMLQYGTAEFEVNPNCLLFLKPTEVKSWKATTNDQEGYYCIFNELFLATNSRENQEIKNNPLFTLNNSPMLPLDQAELVTMRSIFGILFNEFSEKSSFSEDMCRLYLRIILLKSRRLLHETIVESKVESPAAAQLTRRFKDILEEEFAERKRNGSHLRTPSDYAEKLCVHTNYLNASVKRATGKTSQEIIKDRVFQEAQILLKYTLLTTSEIADELGFKETTHFCSFFKKMASVTPLQFRRTNSVRYGETM